MRARRSVWNATWRRCVIRAIRRTEIGARGGGRDGGACLHDGGELQVSGVRERPESRQTFAKEAGGAGSASLASGAAMANSKSENELAMKRDVECIGAPRLRMDWDWKIEARRVAGIHP